MSTELNPPSGHPRQDDPGVPLAPHFPPGLPPELAAAQRIALRLQAIRQSALPLILQVTHGMGGGVERHVRELHALLQGRAWVLILRPGPTAGVVRLAFDTADEVEQLAFTLPGDGALLQRTLLAAGLARIHVHHVFGFPEAFWPLLHGLQCPLDLTLHDYAILGGSPTLTNGQGLYAGWRINADHECSDPAHAKHLRTLAARAQRCLVPSRDMQHRLSLAMPWLGTRAVAHPDRECFGPYPHPAAPRLQAGQPLRVLCLGALGREKGVEVLRAVAALARKRGVPVEFSLLGSAHIPLGAAVAQRGTYSDAQLPTLLAREQPHLLWFPVRCPETWSYTLSAALEAGAPVLASNLGAFAERLDGRPLSWLQVHTSTADDWLTAMLRIREQFVKDQAAPIKGAPTINRQAQGWCQPDTPTFYRQDYLIAERNPDMANAPALPALHHWQSRHVSAAHAVGQAGWRKRLLICALRIREWPLLGSLLACIPYNLQRRVKRMLSRAPMR